MTHAHALLLAALAIAASCTTSVRSRLESERAAWVRARPAAYRYVYSRASYMAGGKYEVHVRNGRVSSVSKVDWMGDRGPAETADHPTLDEIFEDIVKAYESKAEEVEVSFDPTYHYPRKVRADYKKMATDDEWSVEITEFAEESSPSSR